MTVSRETSPNRKGRTVRSPLADPKSIAAEVRSHVEAALSPLNENIPAGFLDRIEKFAAILALWGTRTNLTARPDDPGEIAFHILDSLAPLTLGDPPADPIKAAFAGATRILDVGSGAGFPGLILASALTAQFTLAEARRKRASFLKAASVEMGLANIAVEQRRLSASALDGAFDIAISRALGPPADFYAIAGATLARGASAILYANPDQRIDSGAARLFGLLGEQRLAYSVHRGESEIARTLVVFRKP
jgi:16S rRNA (guanine527-N7)-methyltransferase